MNDLIETIEYKGREIEVFYDFDVESPDAWGNDDVFLVYDHRQFYVQRDGFDPDNIFNNMEEGFKLFDGYWVFPLYAYIHSGVSLSLGRNKYPFTCGFDTSFKGFVLVKRQAKWSYKENQAYKIAESLVETWNIYLSGEVYGYNSDSGSCWGFYGDEGKEQMIAEAKGEIDYDIKKERKEHFERVKTWIKNHVPFYARKPICVDLV